MHSTHEDTYLHFRHGTGVLLHELYQALQTQALRERKGTISRNVAAVESNEFGDTVQAAQRGNVLSSHLQVLIFVLD